MGINKLDTYYTKTDDTTMYTVATGELDIKIMIHFLTVLYYKFIMLIIKFYSTWSTVEAKLLWR